MAGKRTSTVSVRNGPLTEIECLLEQPAKSTTVKTNDRKHLDACIIQNVMRPPTNRRSAVLVPFRHRPPSTCCISFLEHTQRTVRACAAPSIVCPKRNGPFSHGVVLQIGHFQVVHGLVGDLDRLVHQGARSLGARLTPTPAALLPAAAPHATGHSARRA